MNFSTANKNINQQISREYKSLLKISYQTLNDDDKVLIRKALEIAIDAHSNQTRKSGIPYIFHPISVAKIVASKIGLDAPSIASALLHDVVEDTDYTINDIEKLFSTQRINKGDQKPSEFIVKNEPIDKIEFSNLEEKKQTIREMLVSGYADSFLVMKKGKIIFEEYFNDMDQSSLHLINSISKNFLGMLTGIIEKNKLIDVNKKVSEYLSPFKTVFSPPSS